MALTITHDKLATIPDDPNAEIGSDEWNGPHNIEGSIAWSEVTDKPTTFPPATHDHDGDYSPLGHDHDADYDPIGEAAAEVAAHAGTNTHAQLDTFVASKAAASGLASLDAASKVVQDPANATATPTASKIPIADASGFLDLWVSGWISAGEAWTYASADDPTFTFTISGDKTAKHFAGQRIKLTQTTVKYFIITKVVYSSPNTTVTAYGGTDYDLANAAITEPFYSREKAPLGFPLSHSKWDVIVTDTAARTINTPTINVWYFGAATQQISIPIGCWDVDYQFVAYSVNQTDNALADFQATLSTSSSSETDAGLTSWLGALTTGVPGADSYVLGTLSKSKLLDIATKTLYYLIGRTLSANVVLITMHNAYGNMIIRAKCNYL